MSFLVITSSLNEDVKGVVISCYRVSPLYSPGQDEMGSSLVLLFVLFITSFIVEQFYVDVLSIVLLCYKNLAYMGPSKIPQTIGVASVRVN